MGFISKKDLFRYFTEQRKLFIISQQSLLVHLYIPGKHRVAKDFLNQVLVEEKVLLEIKSIKFVNVPNYDELAVQNIFSLMKDDAQFNKYFPDKFAKGIKQDRDYFWNVMATIRPVYTKLLIR
jgi:hypothetical protein